MHALITKEQCKTIIRFWNRARNCETGSGSPAHTCPESPWPILDPTGATYDDACVVWGHSPVDSHKLSSWKVVHQCELITHMPWWVVNDLSGAQFCDYQWFNVDGTWPQTTHASSIRIRPVGYCRLHNFYVSRLYRAYVTTCCHVGYVELWNVHYSRYTDATLICTFYYYYYNNCLLELGSLVTSHL